LPIQFGIGSGLERVSESGSNCNQHQEQGHARLDARPRVTAAAVPSSQVRPVHSATSALVMPLTL
jgi:hypothetical protein